MHDRPLLHYWLILYRRARLVGLTFLSTIGFAALISILLPKEYEARSVMFVPSSDVRVSFRSSENSAGLTSAPVFPSPDEDVAALHIGLLQSRNITDKICAEFPQKTPERLRMDVDFVTNKYYYLEVYVRDRNPKLAADIANAYPRHFNDLQRSFMLARFQETRRTLEAQIQKVSEALAQAKEHKAAYEKETKVLSVRIETEKLTDQKNALLSDLSNTEVDLTQSEEKLKSLREQVENEAKTYLPGEMVTTNVLIEKLRGEISDLELQLAGFATDLTAEHPQAVAVRAQRDLAKAALEQEIQRVLKSQTKSADSLSEKLRHDLAVAYVDSDVLRARIPALRQSIAKITQAIRELPDRERRFDDMDSVIRRYEATYQALLDKEDEVAGQLAWQFQSAVVSEVAVPPDSPAFPILWLNVFLSGVLGLVAGVLYAFFLEYLDDTRRSMLLNEAMAAPAPGGGE